jgi:hypothetical protein
MDILMDGRIEIGNAGAPTSDSKGRGIPPLID